MNQETILGIVRHLLTIGGGILVQKGHLEPGQADTIAGAVLALVGVAWSMLHKKQVAKQLEEATK